MIAKLDHVCLAVADLDEASTRWQLQFGLTERARSADRADLSCDDEPVALALERAVEGEAPGFRHVAWRLGHETSLDEAAARLEGRGVAFEREGAGPGDQLALADVEGNHLKILPYAPPADRRVAHARPAPGLRPGHARRLGHVNFLTARIQEQVAFYRDVLGMGLTDWLGEGGCWLHVDGDHHAMALVDKGYSHLHHLAFDVVDIGQMRDALDHLGRHGRWLGWGPTRHGVGGNIASYVRITEEPLFVELYCDMERLAPDHEPRVWPDDRSSSNTWGPLPPRSYFRFDAIAVDSERESLEALGTPLPPAPVETHA